MCVVVAAEVRDDHAAGAERGIEIAAGVIPSESEVGVGRRRTVADRDDLAVRLNRDGSRTDEVADRRRHDAAAAEARVENPARVVTRDGKGRVRSARRNELAVGLESKRPCVGADAAASEVARATSPPPMIFTGCPPGTRNLPRASGGQSRENCANVAYVYARRSPDCPPVPASRLGALPISFVLNPGTVTKTAVD